MELYKRYVDVVVFMGKERQLIPLFLYWEGQKFQIDKVIEIKNASSVVGGCGILYKVRIQNKERKLFLEKDRWFIESERP